MGVSPPHPPWVRNSPWLAEKEASSRFFDAGCTYVPDKNESDHISDQKKRNLIAKYDGAVLYADSQIGRIIDKLKEKGLAKKTVIAISADHGYELLDHGTGTHGFCPYDEVVRIPLIIYMGTEAKGPRVFNRQGRIFDIGPTLLHLVGVDPPRLWEGTSLLKNDKRVPRYAFTVGYNVQSVRTSHFKLIYQNIQSRKKKYWKSPGYEFYDLSSDPRESKDLSSSNLPEFMILKKELSLYGNDLLNKEYLPGTAIPKKARLDENTIEMLKSLGYIK